MKNTIFQTRLSHHIDELRYLYMELYDNSSMYAELEQQMKFYYDQRSSELKAQDREREKKTDWYKQNDMIGMMLYIDNFAGDIKGVEKKLDYLEKSNVNFIHLMPFLDTVEGRSDGGYAVSDFRKVQKKLGTMKVLVNRGIDIIRLDAVPYIWKELGTPCRNLQKVHTIVRMISEIVCPGVLLLGEVVMEPERVVPYFGTLKKPECHMLYNVTTMATTWHTVATRDVHLLKKQLDIVNSLPKEYVFLNYLRCHDDIGWGLDYPTLAQEGINEASHKKYLNDYFLGYAGGSNSRGELYNYDPMTGDSRYLHRSFMNWENVRHVDDEKSVEGRIYQKLSQLERLRKQHKAFVSYADAWTMETHNSAVLAMGRYYDKEKIIGVFNFSEQDKTIWIDGQHGVYVDLITERQTSVREVDIPAYGFYWLQECCKPFAEHSSQARNSRADCKYPLCYFVYMYPVFMIIFQ